METLKQAGDEMKKKLTIFALIIVIIAILTIIVFANNSQNTGQNKQDKVLTEISYLESEFINLLNTLNNIKFENYNIEITEIKEDDSSAENDKSKDNSESGGEDSGGSGTTEKNTKYRLEPEGVLTTTNNTVNWGFIKERIEIIYASLPTITLDLYSMNINKDDVLNLNKDFDALALAVKEQNKEKTAEALVVLYDYLPKYLKSISQDSTKIIVMETKANILHAYRFIDPSNWNGVISYTAKAIETYGELFKQLPEDENKQYAINKGYILLNELNNSANLKDKEIYLIKYKNLLEELQTI